MKFKVFLLFYFYVIFISIFVTFWEFFISFFKFLLFKWRLMHKFYIEAYALPC